MKTFELTDDELDTLHDAFNDVGCDCPGVDWDKFKELGVKFGFWEAKKPPTEEELKRQKEFAESLLGRQMIEMFVQNNKYIRDINKLYSEDVSFYNGPDWKWPKGEKTTIRIKLPNDYQVEEKK